MHSHAAMKRIIIYASLLLLLASCGSSRRAAKRADEKSVPEVSLRHQDRYDNQYGDKLVSQARRWLGTPYKYGGESRKGTDCSGMVMVLYRDVAGIKIPRNSGKQQEFCTNINSRELSPGDLVFFTSSRKGNVSHVGLYSGSGKFIHASSSRGVIESHLDEEYYRRHFHSAGRVPGVYASKGNKTGKDNVSRPFRFEAVDHLPSREAPVVVTETIRVVEVRVDTVYLPSPSPTDTIASEVKAAF